MDPLSLLRSIAAVFQMLSTPIKERPRQIAIFVSLVSLPCTLLIIVASISPPTFGLITHWLRANEMLLTISIGAFVIAVLSICWRSLKESAYNESLIDEKTVQSRIRKASRNATSVRVLAGDASFLDSDTEQASNLKKLGKNTQFLVRHAAASPKLLELISSGVQVRAYPKDEQTQSLRGRLIGLENTQKTCIFNRTNDVFQYVELDNLSVAKIFFEHFDKLFSQGSHPFIKCVVFDLAGVAFTGNILKFFKSVSRKIGGATQIQDTDYLCVDAALNLGQRDAVDWIKEKFNTAMSPEQEVSVRDVWSKTWKPNSHIKRIVGNLRSSGYLTAIASNCDRQNGDAYRVRGYFEDYDDVFLSCEVGFLKPSAEFFSSMLRKLNVKPYNCLFIDDHQQNTEAAQKIGMEVILVPRNASDLAIATAIDLGLSKLRVGHSTV